MFIIDICWSRHFFENEVAMCSSFSSCHFILPLLQSHKMTGSPPWWSLLSLGHLFHYSATGVASPLGRPRIHHRSQDELRTLAMGLLRFEVPVLDNFCCYLQYFVGVMDWFLLISNWFFIDFCCYLQYFVGVIAIFVREWRTQSQFLLLFTLL